jgi:hypothetical protein
MGNTVGTPIARVILDDFVGPFWGGLQVIEIASVQNVFDIDEHTTVLMGCRDYVFPELDHSSGAYYLPEVIHVRAGVRQ